MTSDVVEDGLSTTLVDGELSNSLIYRAWHPPPVGSLKLNVDATFFYDTNETGVVMVIRDDLGSTGKFSVGQVYYYSGL